MAKKKKVDPPVIGYVTTHASAPRIFDDLVVKLNAHIEQTNKTLDDFRTSFKNLETQLIQLRERNRLR